MDYKTQINKLANSISTEIINLNKKRKRSAPPTQAFSDFLTHNEQGTWAEKTIFSAIEKSITPIKPVMYGKSDNITAGDEGFKEFYNNYQDELEIIGKRPDILLFDDNKIENYKDISAYSLEDLSRIVPKARAGLEVRSSAYLTKKFQPKKRRPSLSFTPKVEDLMVVIKWINTYNVPHYYVQVFFDGIYAISFKSILEMIKEAKIETMGIKNKIHYGYINNQLRFAIEKNPKNQFKETIHIFLNSGIKIDENINMPKLIANTKELSSGRLLHYISFEKSSAEIDTKSFNNLLEN